MPESIQLTSKQLIRMYIQFDLEEEANMKPVKPACQALLADVLKESVWWGERLQTLYQMISDTFIFSKMIRLGKKMVTWYF
jgi:hypothetical protein